MTWHVGLLYRFGDLLDLIERQPTTRAAVLAEFVSYKGVKSADLIELGRLGSWLKDDSEGRLALTDAGRDLITIHGLSSRLKVQVQKLMEVFLPPWGASLVQGRKAFATYAPIEAVQCFREAGLLDSIDYEVVQWWDSIAARYRQRQDERKKDTGRRGERLSFEYELQRTGREPQWTALEYEGAGYDLRSQVSSNDPRPLVIEVKASEDRDHKAQFYLSRHEWCVLDREENAVLHLWSLAQTQREPRVVTKGMLLPHIPNEGGEATWQILTCPFRAFSLR